jgi:tagatose-1,6-bisphosphate aldolase
MGREWCYKCECPVDDELSHDCLEYCGACDDRMQMPHDCPYAAGVRHAPELIVKEEKKSDKIPLPWALTMILCAGVGAYLVVEFAKWLGSR